jgi:uncharacterized protein (TIGR03905 family)
LTEKTIEFHPKGVCSQVIRFSISGEGRLHGLAFEDGCDGNALGLSVLVEGMDAAQAASRLLGIRCGRKKTSCPDQLAIAIRGALADMPDIVPGDATAVSE